ncbi:MAG TPA: malto-oligosyltrehalose trehalohydrolase [Tepidisphaeraceae bacterium]|jgi:maltooligosyltrehalose trehalohydrolase
MNETRVRRCGAVALSDESIEWRVWAPKAGAVELVLIDGNNRRGVAMRDQTGGFFAHAEGDVPEGQRYVYRLDGGEDRPDPCSLWQPEGIPGPSAVVRPERFAWTDRYWRGVRRESLVFYELHVGTFTPEGTFEAIVTRLAELKDLGVTAIELMPVGQFPGSRNWGYDGVLPYAAQNTYGGPQGLAKLVDAAHGAGLAVVLDVVYNHYGPEGNYLDEFGTYFTDEYKTPWGRAINYDQRGSDPVRRFVLDNVRMWLDEFHLDGLRLDAIHAIYDMGAKHLLREIREVADDVAERTGRFIHIVAESDLNDPKVIASVERGGHGLDAQWSDDFHHAAHSLLTGERRGYYSDFGSLKQLARALEAPFVYAGHFSAHRGRRHGAPPDGIPGDRFVVCIQNHDQIGNRAKGDRLTTLLQNPAQQRLAASLLLLSPYLPLLFMGEEYAETRPFPFFCSFCGKELIQAVREGRKREFAHFVEPADEVPDAQVEATFASAKLTWSWPDGTPQAGMRRLYADLLAARRRWPALRDFINRRARLMPHPETGPVIELIRGARSDVSGVLRACFNFSPEPQPLPESVGAAQAIFSSESPRYGGARAQLGRLRELRPFECLAFGPTHWV